MNVNNAYGTQQVASVFDVSGVNTTRRNNSSRIAFGASGDTVSISDEAMEAYRNAKSSNPPQEQSKSSVNLLQESDEAKKMQSLLTSFFNTWFSQKPGNDGKVISGDVQAAPSNGEMLPENKKLLEEIEAQIEKITSDSKSTPFDPALSRDVFEKIQPLRQKLNALHALGRDMVLTEDMLEKSASFLQNMENEWSKGMNVGVDASSQLRSVVKQETTAATNTEEKVRKVKDNILSKLLE